MAVNCRVQTMKTVVPKRRRVEDKRAVLQGQAGHPASVWAPVSHPAASVWAARTEAGPSTVGTSGSSLEGGSARDPSLVGASESSFKVWKTREPSLVGASESSLEGASEPSLMGSSLLGV